MCCRFGTGGEYKSKLDSLLERKIDDIYKDGEIRPTENALVIVSEKGRLSGADMKWGFRTPENALIINARAETLFEKPMFKLSATHMRCLIPCTYFCEWDKDRNKVQFTVTDMPVIFMAGLFDAYNNFTVITTVANESMMSVHDRMPLIIPERDLRTWLFDTDKAKELLSTGQPVLNAYREYEQLSLFDMVDKR